MAVITEMERELEYELDCPCSCKECEAGDHNGCEYGGCWLTLAEHK